MPSKAETLLPSYQTNPCTPRSPPVRPAPPLTRTARLPREQAVGRWLVVDRQAAWPKDIFILRGAGAQFVGRAGGEDGAVCSRRGAFLAGPLRARRGLAVLGGGWGVGTAFTRDHVRFYIHNLEPQSPF